MKSSLCFLNFLYLHCLFFPVFRHVVLGAFVLFFRSSTVIYLSLKKRNVYFTIRENVTDDNATSSNLVMLSVKIY